MMIYKIIQDYTDFCKNFIIHRNNIYIYISEYMIAIQNMVSILTRSRSLETRMMIITR